jgi:hypothetical protein
MFLYGCVRIRFIRGGASSNEGGAKDQIIDIEVTEVGYQYEHSSVGIII